MAFRKKHQRILRMKPDILVLQECENIEKLQPLIDNIKYNNLLWYGKNPNKGIAILSFNQCTVEIKKEFDSRYEYIMPLSLTCNDSKINLFCIWAMPHPSDRSKNYVGQIWGAIHHYEKLLNKPSILIGDFNSNSFWDKKIKNGNHTDLVKFLEAKKIRSIYHEKEKLLHGNEKQPTFYLVKNKLKPYHLDYCFSSQQMITDQTKIKVGKYSEWIKLSDHMPLIIENLKI